MLLRFLSSTEYTKKLAAPQCLHYQNTETFSKKWHPLQRIKIGKDYFYSRNVSISDERHLNSIEKLNKNGVESA